MYEPKGITQKGWKYVLEVERVWVANCLWFEEWNLNIMIIFLYDNINNLLSVFSSNQNLSSWAIFNRYSIRTVPYRCMAGRKMLGLVLSIVQLFFFFSKWMIKTLKRKCGCFAFNGICCQYLENCEIIYINTNVIYTPQIYLSTYPIQNFD